MSAVRKATLKKEYRERERQRKRFNTPLPLFLETKYPKIYEEYMNLYNQLNTRHPQTRNLSKTNTFKIWKNKVHRQAPEAVSKPIENNIVSNGSNTQTTEAATATAENIIPTNADNAQTTEATSAMAEIVIPSNISNDQATETANETVVRMDLNELADIMFNVEGRVDEIIRELREDPDLRDLMEQAEAQPVDEGIDINPLDDIEYDIEPFDFEVEVESYPW